MKIFTKQTVWTWVLLLFIVFGVTACSSSHSSDKYLKYPIPLTPIQELNYSPLKSSFAVWAPTADEVRLMLYTSGEGGHPERMIPMNKEEETGVWSISLSEDLLGHFYTFNVKIDNVWQGDTPGIFAKAVGINGKRAAIIDRNKTNPLGWKSDRPISIAHPTDAVLYELHVRSFTAAPCSGVDYGGKFLGLAQDSTFSSSGHLQTGLSHLKELGVTHVKLMPIFDFNNKDEREEDAYMWGYDPLNPNVPEGSYSTDPIDPVARIIELKLLIQALHQVGIGVVMDVSYAYSNPATSNFQKTVPGYYFKQESGDNLKLAMNGKAEAATYRPFVGQYIKESLAYWMHEYHIDGFNFDLIHLYEPELLQEITTYLRAINPSVLLMGDSSDEKLVLDPALRAQIPLQMNPFCHTLRANPKDSVETSYLLGNYSLAESFKSSLVGWLPHDSLVIDSIPTNWRVFNNSPIQAINYVASHEGITFGDYLDVHTSSIYYNNEKARLSKLGYAVLLTAQGIPLLSSGEEFFRSKNKLYLTEKCGGDINQIDWGLKAKHLEHYNYIKGLVQLRKKHPAFRLSNTKLLNEHVDFISYGQPQLLGYRLKNYANGDEWEDIIVIFNTGKEAQRVPIPEGQYVVVCRDGFVNEQGLSYAYGQAYVTGQSAMILYRTDKAVYIPQAKPNTAEKETDVELKEDEETILDVSPAQLPSSIQIEVPKKIEIK